MKVTVNENTIHTLEYNPERNRMERMKEAAPDMYNFVKIVYELLTEDDDSGERTMNWHFATDVARQILDYVDGKENNND